MAHQTSGTARVPARDYIVSYFQGITGCNMEDSLFYLDEYNWQIENVIKDLERGKEFRSRSIMNSNDRVGMNQIQQRSNTPATSQQNSSYHSRSTLENDEELARLIAVYGHADEQARRHNQQKWKEKYSYLEDPMLSKIYHEKQEYLRCGLHALNNLFQSPNTFTREYLDSIMQKYDPTKSSNDYGVLFVGDYDLRVLIEAIQQRGFRVQQINLLRDPTLESHSWDEFFGLLVNFNGQHWFAIKSFEGIFYNLDSTYFQPQRIGERKDLIRYVQFMMEAGCNMYLFAVISTSISASKKYESN